MREAPVRGLILRLALPTVASMLVTAFYNLADAWFVGLLDTQSVAAVGVAFPAMAVIQAVGFFFGHGSGNTLARMLGAGDRHGARRSRPASRTQHTTSAFPHRQRKRFAAHCRGW